MNGALNLKKSGNGSNKKVRSPFTEAELKYFERLILDKKEQALEQVEKLREKLEQEFRDNLDNDTAYSYHICDSASTTMYREQLYLQIDRELKLVGYLNRALERIKNGTYGICRVTGQVIDKERLEAIPHTEISVEAKLREKKAT